MKRFLEWLCGTEISANPDLVGKVAITESDVDPEALARIEREREKAKQYLSAKGLKPKPLYNTRNA